MPTPFPGMDPYLERRGLWEAVHTRLIVAIADALEPSLGPNYRVDVERRTYLAILASEPFVGKPDVLVIAGSEQVAAVSTAAVATKVPHIIELPMPVEVVERYLEVRDATTGEAITVIEILSHSNKSTREGREQYERNRLQILASMTNLVEIDLLRSGAPFPFRLLDSDSLKDYNIVVSRAWSRPRADAFFVSVREPLPDIPIPLRPGEAEPVLALNQILQSLYERARYHLAVDYRQPPDPPLRNEDVPWAIELLKRSGTIKG